MTTIPEDDRPGSEFPVSPVRDRLYSAEELLGGFRPDVPRAWLATLDGRTYRATVMSGMPVAHRAETGMLRALHDHAISTALQRRLEGHACVAVMGGHRMGRADPHYRVVTRLGRALTEAGYLVLTGGGPGAMEASHLGASLAGHGDAELLAAVDHLRRVAEFPHLGTIVAADGTVGLEAGDALHSWQVPAFEIAAAIRAGAAASVAVPTWHYGHEPPTPFAPELAKYFQNSVREDGLLAVAHHGVVFTPGGPGTIQEVFQDACQNAYRSYGPPGSGVSGSGVTSPMVFLDLGGAWTVDRPVLRALRFVLGDARFARFVHVCDTVEEAVAFLQRTPPAE
jgi:predicted Rossmann-fold nucleotide-binding protein